MDNKFVFSIGHLKFAVDAQYTTTKEYCAGYLCKGQPDYCISISKDDLRAEHEYFCRQALAEGQVYPAFSDSFIETLALQRKVTECLFRHNILLLHGSAIAVDGQSYLFIAKSGTGKSTHSALWRQLLGDRAVMVNDDKPFLEIKEEGVTVHGSPWNGVHKLGNNISVPLKAICILERGPENKLRQVSAKDSVYMLMQQSSRPHDPALLTAYMDMLDKLSQKVCFYRLSCNTDIEAAQVAYEGMCK